MDNLGSICARNDDPRFADNGFITFHDRVMMSGGFAVCEDNSIPIFSDKLTQLGFVNLLDKNVALPILTFDFGFHILIQ